MGSWLFPEEQRQEGENELHDEPWTHQQADRSTYGQCNSSHPSTKASSLPQPIDGADDNTTSTANNVGNRSQCDLALSDVDYSASVASSGSGFHGETRTSILSRSQQNLAPLPADAMEILSRVQSYLEKMTSNELLSERLNDSDKTFLSNLWNEKLKDALTDLIQSAKMSKNAFDTLAAVMTALQATKYDLANKKITHISKQKEEFKINKIWIINFKSIVRIAKRYNI